MQWPAVPLSEVRIMPGTCIVETTEKPIAAMRTVELVYRVDRRRISLIKFIFEAYEGLAMVTTLEPSSGVIALLVAPGCEQMAKAVITDLGKHFLIEPMAPADTILVKAGE